MKFAGILTASVFLAALPAFAQTAETNAQVASPAPAKPVAPATTPAPGAPAAAPSPAQPSSPYKPVTPAPAARLVIPQPYNPMAKVEQAALNTAVPAKDGVKRMIIMRGLDKITGRPANILAPVGVPVHYATLTITARYCYSTPIIEPPETTAFVQIQDHRPDQDVRQVFSGWMLASSPSLNALQHPLYDVWVMSCATNQPGQLLPAIASTSTVKATSPDATAKEAVPDLPEDSGQ